MAAQPNLVRVQEHGQVTLPANVRKRLGLKEGDLVVVEETAEGVLLTPRGVAAINALSEIGDALRAEGLTFDDMIERGKSIREELYREQYAATDPDPS